MALWANTVQTVTTSVGSVLLTTAAFTGPAAPVVAAGGGLVDLFGTVFGGLFNPDTNKIDTSNIVNQVEPYLQANLQQWKNLPPDQKTTSAQQQALATFDYWWGQVVANCESGKYGSAGTNCVTDRQRGGKFDWFAAYRDPIANDT